MKSDSKNQLHSSQLRLFAVLAVISLITWGCASITPEEMTPTPSTTPVTKIGGNVRVMDVTGGKEKHSGGVKRISNEQFKAALLLTLQQSGLFDAVSTDYGDVRAYAVIQSEDPGDSATGFMQFTARMVVTYKFLDNAGNLIWSASYKSEASYRDYSSSAPTKVARACAGAARENLKSLVEGIQREWPKTGASSLSAPPPVGPARAPGDAHRDGPTKVSGTSS